MLLIIGTATIMHKQRWLLLQLIPHLIFSFTEQMPKRVIIKSNSNASHHRAIPNDDQLEELRLTNTTSQQVEIPALTLISSQENVSLVLVTDFHYFQNILSVDNLLSVTGLSTAVIGTLSHGCTEDPSLS